MNVSAQDTTNLMDQMEKDEMKKTPGYATAKFMTKRVVDGQ